MPDCPPTNLEEILGSPCAATKDEFCAVWNSKLKYCQKLAFALEWAVCKIQVQISGGTTLDTEYWYDPRCYVDGSGNSVFIRVRTQMNGVQIVQQLTQYILSDGSVTIAEPAGLKECDPDPVEPIRKPVDLCCS